MKYLIAIDLDGTLLNDNGELSNENIKAINKVKTLGHKVIIATGRSYSGAINIYKQLNLDTPLVIHNGAYVINPSDKTFKIQKNTLCNKLTRNIITSLKPFLLGAYYTIKDTTYAYNLNKSIEKFFNGENSEYVVDGDLSTFDYSPCNIVLTVNSKYKNEFLSVFNNNYKDLLDLRLWMEEKDYLVYEVFDKNISKYTGIKHVLKHYNLSNDNLIAIGDNHNDVDMIKNARIGVAVSNAADVLKKEAKYISPFRNSEDAVASILKHFTTFINS